MSDPVEVALVGKLRPGCPALGCRNEPLPIHWWSWSRRLWRRELGECPCREHLTLFAKNFSLTIRFGPDGSGGCACGDLIRGDHAVCAACRGTDRYINQAGGTVGG